MGLGKKKRYSFLDIIRGIQHAVNAAQDMLQAQQLHSLQKFWDGNSGEPISRTIKIKDSDLCVPLVALLPHNHLGMDDIEIKFCAKIEDLDNMVATDAIGNDISAADLKLALDDIKPGKDDTMQITIRFKAQAPTEGLSRLIDEYNKQI